MIQRKSAFRATRFAVAIVCMTLTGALSAPCGGAAAPQPVRGATSEARQVKSPSPLDATRAAPGGTIGVWFDAACTISTLTTTASPETVTAYIALRDCQYLFENRFGGWEGKIETVGDGVVELGWEPLLGTNLDRSPRLQVCFAHDERPVSADPLLVARGRVVVAHPGATARIYVHAYDPCSLGYPTASFDWPSEVFAPAPCVWPRSESSSYDYWDSRPLPMGWASGSEALPVAEINPQPSAPLLRVAAATLDFGDVAPGASRERTLSIANIGGGTLTGEVPAPIGAGFELVSGAAYALGPGQTQSVTLRFSPGSGGAFSGTLPLGSGVALTGSAPDAGTCGFAPASLDFGRVPNYRAVFRTATLTNATSQAMYLNLWAAWPGWIGAPTWVDLLPGASIGIPIAFSPNSLTPLDASLEVSGCGSLRLLGEVSESPPVCDLSDAVIYFGPVAVGWVQQREVRLTNVGDGFLDGEVSLQGAGFQVVSGAGPFHLANQQWHSVVVDYAPTQDGDYAGQLEFGSAPCGPVALRGSVSHCESATTELAFGLVPLGGYRDLSFPVRNLGDATVTTRLSSDNPSFVFPSGDISIRAGETHNLPVRFAPKAVGDQVATVSTGPGIGLRIACRGLCQDLPPVCQLYTGGPDFGQWPAGTLLHRLLGITNTGGGSLTGNVTVEGDGFGLASGAGPFALAPGAQKAIDVTFQSSVTGIHAGFLRTGAALCGDVPLTVVVPAPVTLPDSLDMGEVRIGCSRERPLTLRNPNNFPVIEQLDIVSPYEFSFEVHGGSLSIPANGEASATVVFSPRTVGSVAGTYTTVKTGAVRTRLTGRGLASAPICSLSTQALQFGLVEVGEARTLFLTVFNTGCGTLSAYGGVQGEGLMLTKGAGNFALDHGESALLVARFAPTRAGDWTGAVDLGLPCGVVPCTGTGYSHPDVTGQDLLGIYFDPLGGSNTRRTTQPYEPVDAYLVLVNPSEESGVSGWECSVEITGGALGAGWTLPGDAFNVATPPSFQVGLRQPWMWDSSLQLASLRFLQSSPQEATLFYIHPYGIPSLPGTPVYVAGGDASVLLPMRPSSGDESAPVASVNGGDIVEIAAPAPTVECEDGTVSLSWEYDPARADGCRLYRRTGEIAQPEIAAQSLTNPSGHVVFADLRADPAAGATLRYSYALLRDGREVARSPEAAVTCKTPAATLLRSIFPNPFNPQTRVVFDVARPGWVNVAVYDAGGRLVRTLCAESLPAGSYTRVWDGRDERGRAAASGVYYARLSVDGKVQMSKMSLVR